MNRDSVGGETSSKPQIKMKGDSLRLILCPRKIVAFLPVCMCMHIPEAPAQTKTVGKVGGGGCGRAELVPRVRVQPLVGPPPP